MKTSCQSFKNFPVVFLQFMRTENEVSTELFPRLSSSGRGKEMNNVFINLRKEKSTAFIFNEGNYVYCLL